MNKRISVVIPNYNKSSVIDKCLEAAFSSEYDDFEVVVVDDCSTDNSVEIIKKHPCRLIALDEHSGASRARNTGAKSSNGEIIFFIDADCLLEKGTLSAVNNAFSKYSPSPGKGGAVIGGTYTKIPYDDGFFSTFQSVFINYSETKKEEPDYIATHAMIIGLDAFNKSGGFSENFLPLIEDVEFSHRLKKAGYKLVMSPDILVRHIFNFTLIKSLKNAFRKSLWWTVYSLKNRDLFKDSGTASVELKINAASYFLNLLFIILFFYHIEAGFLILASLTFSVNFLINMGLFKSFYKVKGLSFSILAVLYYTLVYPLAVGAGAISGLLQYLRIK